MRDNTYRKLESRTGYIETCQLLKHGFTNRQIACFVKEGLLERVCHGCYWVRREGIDKPKDYKAIEVCLSDINAVICADSACFYHGLIAVEPDVLSVATCRNERSAIKMNFPVVRHYISEEVFEGQYMVFSNAFGRYNMFDLERSVCDCIRFRESIDVYVFELIIDRYRALENKQQNRIMEYAKRLQIQRKVQKYIGAEWIGII